jgi:MOSC domain-containing protein YiiM
MRPPPGAPPGAPPPEPSAGAARLLSVNVATPRVLGRAVSGGREVVVRSGIAELPVAGEPLLLDRENLEGDRQADLRVHGGADKAVSAYPSDHRGAWGAEEGRAFGPAAFGESLALAGVAGGEVGIGDVWAWGEARLQVSQPRGPCFKLELHTGRPGLIERMRANGRTGWYFRVLEPGRVPVRGPLRVAQRHPAGVSVLRAHLATLPDGMPDEERRAILRDTPLAAAWQRPIRARLARR